MDKKFFIWDIDKKFNDGLFPIVINDKEIITSKILKYKKNRYLRSQYSLELVLHKMMLHHQSLTKNYLDSNIVVIPIYLFLLAWEEKYFYNVNKVVQSIELIKLHIQKFTNDNKQVLIIYSDVMWEDKRCFLNYFEFGPNVYFVCYEDVISKNNQIPVPFCTHIMCDPKKYKIPIKYKKEHLISYIGRERPEIKLFQDINVINTNEAKDNKWISINNKELYNTIDNTYLKSYFSLQPHGDKKSRKGFYHSLLMGCIPVVFENNYQIYEKIFSNLVDLQDICIILSYKDKEKYTEILHTQIKNIPDKINQIEKIKHLLLYDKNDLSIIDYIMDHMK